MDQAARELKKVYLMRENLIQFLFKAEKQVKLMDLPIAMGAKSSINDVFEIMETILALFEETTDWELATVKVKLDDWEQCVDTLSSVSDLLLEEELNIRFQKIMKRMKAVIPEMPDKVQQRFKGKIILDEDGKKSN